MMDVTKVKNPIPKNRPLLMKQFIELLELDKSLHLGVTLTEMAPKYSQLFDADYKKGLLIPVQSKIRTVDKLHHFQGTVIGIRN